MFLRECPRKGRPSDPSCHITVCIHDGPQLPRYLKNSATLKFAIHSRKPRLGAVRSEWEYLVKWSAHSTDLKIPQTNYLD